MLNRYALGMALMGVVICASSATAVTEKQINNTIEKMQKHLFQSQQNGRWPDSDHPEREATGQTALVVYALLQSGAHAQDPRIQKSIKYLANTPSKGTYARAVRAHVWAALPDEYRKQLVEEKEWLIKAENGDGGFRYGQDVGGDWDNSATQYGALGVWEAAKRGVTVDPYFWRRVWGHYESKQNGDGGWAYRGKGSTGSMTSAGITVGYIVQQQLHRGSNTVPAELKKDIQNGLKWLDNHFQPGKNPGKNGWWSYYIYGVERVGLASGVRYLNGKDWFRDTAQVVVNRSKNGQMGDKAWKTAFGLLFLARGKVPVWANKLALNNNAWNRRPSDLFFLTKHLSEYSERRLNWLRAPINTNERAWLNAPVLYLSTHQAIDLSDKQRDKIKHYIELGGTLVVNPEGNNRAVHQSANQLANKMFPDYEMEQVGLGHPLVDLVRDAPRARMVQTVSNGARDLILVLPGDWGMSWQARPAGQRTGTAWKAAVNLWALMTNRGRIEGRLRDPLVPNQGGGSGTVKVIRAKYDGNWNPEPLAMTQVDQFMKNRANLGVNTTTKALKDIGDADAALVHLAGVETHQLTDAEKSAIKQYVNNGGTVLVETVGGRGEFALTMDDSGIENQLTEVFNRSSTQLSPASSIINGQGLSKGFDLSQIGYRPFSVVNSGARGAPRLTTIRVNDRPAIITSAEDLSVGCLGVPRWNINGYNAESARKLFTNILLFANNN